MKKSVGNEKNPSSSSRQEKSESPSRSERRQTRREIIEENLRAIKRTRIAFAKW